jgi:hypothetical protein
MRLLLLASWITLPVMQGLPASAESRLAVRVSPAAAFEPADPVLTVRVDTHPDNRLPVVEADSGTSYRSSTEQLDGESGPAVRVFRWKALAEGHYQVAVSLVGPTGVRAVARAQALVMPAEVR